MEINGRRKGREGKLFRNILNLIYGFIWMLKICFWNYSINCNFLIFFPVFCCFRHKKSEFASISLILTICGNYFPLNIIYIYIFHFYFVYSSIFRELMKSLKIFFWKDQSIPLKISIFQKISIELLEISIAFCLVIHRGIYIIIVFVYFFFFF